MSSLDVGLGYTVTMLHLAINIIKENLRVIGAILAYASASRENRSFI
jgi:hypothetical protein